MSTLARYFAERAISRAQEDAQASHLAMACARDNWADCPEGLALCLAFQRDAEMYARHARKLLFRLLDNGRIDQ